MVIRNWREALPSIVHDFGIDYKLLKGQADFDPKQEHCCMEGMLYVAYAMLQEGKAYEAHAHGDHEEVCDENARNTRKSFPRFAIECISPAGI